MLLEKHAVKVWRKQERLEVVFSPAGHDCEQQFLNNEDTMSMLQCAGFI